MVTFTTKLALLGLLAVVRIMPVSAGPPPVEYFSQLPQVSNMELSADGSQIAYVLNIESGSVLLSMKLGEKPKPLLQTDNKKYRFKWVEWLNEEWLLVSVQYPSISGSVKVGRTGMLRVNVKTRKSFEAWGSRSKYRSSSNVRHFPQFGDRVVSFLPDDPNHFLLALDIMTPTFPGVYRINVKKGSRKLIKGADKPFRWWVADQQGQVRVRQALEEGERIAEYFSLTEHEWLPLWRYREMEEPPHSVLGFGADPNTLYVRELEQGYNAVFTVDLSDPQLPRTLVASDSDHDINGYLIYSPERREPVGVSTTNNRGAPIYWDASFKAFQEAIDQALPDSTNWLRGFSREESRYIVKSTNHRRPATYYFGDRKKRSLTPLVSEYPELAKLQLSGKNKFTYTAADGLNIEAYITEPWGSPPKPWPLVVFPHGGPHVRNYKSFDYWSEFFASRGYAVLQMNFRGSTGYGWDFMKKGIQKVGREMQRDIINGVQQVIAKGVADPSKICIAGASYGGYAALWGTISTPELFRCAISFAGVTDWGEVLRRSRHFIDKEVVRSQLGNSKMLKEVSVLDNADKINVPLLLVHGDKDRRVEPVHSRRLARKLEKLGKDYLYVELENGTHSLGKQENRTRLFKEMDTFLALHLGPD